MPSLHGCTVSSQGVFFTEALAEFQHVNCMIVQIWEVKRVPCCARAETNTEVVASMVATPLLSLILAGECLSRSSWVQPGGVGKRCGH